MMCWLRTGLFLLLLPCVAGAQVNTEKLRRADSTSGVFFSTGIALGLDRGNSDFVSASGGLRLDYTRPGNDNFIVAQYDFKESDRGKITNKGFLHLRTMWLLSDLLTLEGFTQAEFNEFTSLENRDLLGAGTRWHPLRTGYDENDISFELFIGIGLMFEHEQYVTSPMEIATDRMRSTNYLTFNTLFTRSTLLRIVTYYQPVISSPADFRFSNESSLDFKVTKALTFSLTASYRYNSRPVLNVKRYDLQLRNGLQLTLP
ncbi:MAG: DUF481 domain-containing protein [Bacteroidota bacterium]